MFNKSQLADMMKKAKEMQDALEKTQAELSRLEIDGESGAGMVKAKITGKHYIKKIDIDDSLFKDGDKEMLEDLVAAAINDAMRKLEDHTASKMGGLTSGIVPDGFKLPF